MKRFAGWLIRGAVAATLVIFVSAYLIFNRQIGPRDSLITPALAQAFAKPSPSKESDQFRQDTERWKLVEQQLKSPKDLHVTSRDLERVKELLDLAEWWPLADWEGGANVRSDSPSVRLVIALYPELKKDLRAGIPGEGIHISRLLKVMRDRQPSPINILWAAFTY